ncbi:MAG TPA: hypothetical protein VHG89_00270 [Verrucomicrobiae bacterium]|nr:hypothetical protein [Verrucomicrobiae bacterium]
MKTFTFLIALFAAAYSLPAAMAPLETFCPHFSTNMPIVWQATNQWPKNLWTYKMLVPRPFTAEILSNAVILASLESRGFPKPSTQYTCFYADDCQQCSCVLPCYFSIEPESGRIQFTEPHKNNLSEAIPSDDDMVKVALECAARFGLAGASLIPRKDYVMLCDSNRICGRGIFLSRSLDGIGFCGNGNDNWGPEGFGIEFGGDWQVRSFVFVWPTLERDKSSRALNADEIISCIRAQKTVVLPNGDEDGYFNRIKSLAAAKKLTVTRITPYYNEGVYGDTSEDPPKMVSPYAELEAVADFGSSNAPVQLWSPITTSEVACLMQPKGK